MTTTTTNPHEDAARLRKVLRLSAAAERQGLTVDALERLDGSGWDALAGLAGVRSPSATTRAQVIDQRRLAAEDGDPRFH